MRQEKLTEGEKFAASITIAVCAYRSAKRLFLALMALVGKEAELGAARALAFLPPNFGDPLRFVGGLSLYCGLDFVKQQSSRQVTIERLGSLFLASDPSAGRAVVQHNAARNLVDVLATGTRGADELFVDVLLAHAERLHALDQLFFLAG
jgi:hypothetical protein